MGMDNLMLSCIRALAENRIQDAKQAAIACCVNDTTKKNAGKTGYYKKLLENGTTTLFELPANRPNRCLPRKNDDRTDAVFGQSG